MLALSHLDEGMKFKPVVGERHTLEGDNIATRVLHTGLAARLDLSELQSATGSIAQRLLEMGLRCTVAVPVIVDGRVWGAAISARRDPNPCPPTPRRGSPTSPTSSRPRSPTPRPTRNLPRLGPGSWRPPMMRGGVWNAICTTAPSSGWCRWGFSCASRRLRCPPNCGAQGTDFRRRRWSGGRVGGGARDLTGDSSRDPVQGRTRSSAQDAGPPLDGPGGARSRRRPTVAGVRRSGRLLRRRRSTHQRRQARTSLAGDRAREAEDANLHLWIRDDGIGGADVGKGSGLIGLKDRAEALRGHMQITSPPGAGTALDVIIPLDSE